MAKRLSGNEMALFEWCRARGASFDALNFDHGMICPSQSVETYAPYRVWMNFPMSPIKKGAIRTRNEPGHGEMTRFQPESWAHCVTSERSLKSAGDMGLSVFAARDISPDETMASIPRHLALGPTQVHRPMHGFRRRVLIGGRTGG